MLISLVVSCRSNQKEVQTLLTMPKSSINFLFHCVLIKFYVIMVTMHHIIGAIT